MAAAAAAHTAAPHAHALLLPYPAQGHVIPFMELADRLLDRGFAVTFVNTEFNHRRVAAAAAGGAVASDGRLRLVAVADGMGDGEDRDNLVRLFACMQEAMPPRLDALLDADDERLGRVTCVVVDAGMSWALDAVKRRGLPAAALWPASAAVFAVLVGAKKLIRDGVIDDDVLELISHQPTDWAFQHPDRGCPTQQGWWAPVAQHINRGGGGRRLSSHEVHLTAATPHLPNPSPI